jgi:hypothetical protein
MSPKSQLNQRDNFGSEVKGSEPSTEEVETTLNVLQFRVNKGKEFDLNTSIENAMKHFDQKLAPSGAGNAISANSFSPPAEVNVGVGR